MPKENPSEFDLIVLLHVYTHDYFLIITSSNRLQLCTMLIWV